MILQGFLLFLFNGRVLCRMVPSVGLRLDAGHRLGTPETQYFLGILWLLASQTTEALPSENQPFISILFPLFILLFTLQASP